MKRNLITVTFLVLAAVILIFGAHDSQPSNAQSRSALVVSSGQSETRQFTVRPKGPLHSAKRKQPPERPPEEPMEDFEEIRMDPPTDPSVRPEDIRPTSPPTVVKVTAGGISETAPKSTPQAPGTFTVYRNTQLANAPVVSGVPLGSSTTNEPSLASNGRVVFWTQNWFAGFSGDRGQTFTYINPYDNFPADGTNDAVNGGFCCDQIAYYERTRALTFWLLQYNPDNNTNTDRLCVAGSQSDVLNNNWLIYDFTPANFGFTTPPTGASGFWLDFPDMAVSDNFLYLTTNIFLRVLPNPTNPCAGTCPPGACPASCTGGCTNPCGSIAAVIARIPLSELAQGGEIHPQFYTDANFTFRPTQGAHGTMYWGAHISNTQIRIYRWAESSNQVLFDNVNHNAFNTGAMTAPSPDGTDFAAFPANDTRIRAAWVANGVIGFMWNAPQSTPPATGFPFPHVWVMRFNENNRTLIDQSQIWNTVEAFLYPSVAVNDRGHLGGTIAAGGGATFFPRALAWMADDFNGGTIAPLESVAFTGNPTNGPAGNRWGDYLSSRVNVPYGNTWVASGYALVGGTGNANVVQRFIWFGRERDTPPAANTVFVDAANTSRYQDGSSAHPYRTVTDGHFAAMPGDTLMIRAGNYFETPRLNKAVTVRSEGGTVRILSP